MAQRRFEIKTLPDLHVVFVASMTAAVAAPVAVIASTVVVTIHPVVVTIRPILAALATVTILSAHRQTNDTEDHQ